MTGGEAIAYDLKIRPLPIPTKKRPKRNPTPSQKIMPKDVKEEAKPEPLPLDVENFDLSADGRWLASPRQRPADRRRKEERHRQRRRRLRRPRPPRSSPLPAGTRRNWSGAWQSPFALRSHPTCKASLGRRTPMSSPSLPKPPTTSATSILPALHGCSSAAATPGRSPPDQSARDRRRASRLDQRRDRASSSSRRPSKTLRPESAISTC